MSQYHHNDPNAATLRLSHGERWRPSLSWSKCNGHGGELLRSGARSWKFGSLSSPLWRDEWFLQRNGVLHGTLWTLDTLWRDTGDWEKPNSNSKCFFLWRNRLIFIPNNPTFQVSNFCFLKFSYVCGLHETGLHIRRKGETRWCVNARGEKVEVMEGDVALVMESPPGSVKRPPLQDLEAEQAICILGCELKAPWSSQASCQRCAGLCKEDRVHIEILHQNWNGTLRSNPKSENEATMRCTGLGVEGAWDPGQGTAGSWRHSLRPCRSSGCVRAQQLQLCSAAQQEAQDRLLHGCERASLLMEYDTLARSRQGGHGKADPLAKHLAEDLDLPMRVGFFWDLQGSHYMQDRSICKDRVREIKAGAIWS